MSTELSPTQRAERWKKGTQLGLVVVGGALVAPIAAMSVVGITGLAIAAVIGYTVIGFAPVFGMMVANARLKAMKAEASRNPVETLQNEYMRRAQLLESRGEAIQKFKGKIASYEDKVSELQQKYGNDRQVQKMAGHLGQLKQLLNDRVKKYKDSAAALKDFELEIEKAGAIWEAAQLAHAAEEGGGAEEEFYAKLKEDTALDSIQDRMNEAFASLDVTMEIKIDEPAGARA